jgi:predicted nucleic acid-binding protein
VIYADTSFLVASLIPDVHSGEAMAMLGKSGSPLVFAPLHCLELANAVRLKVFWKQITAEQAEGAFAHRDHLLRDEAWVRRGTSLRKAIERAEELSAASTARAGGRSLDLLHVALALDLGLKQFWSFDKRQRAVAEEAGLAVNR